MLHLYDQYMDNLLECELITIEIEKPLPENKSDLSTIERLE